MGRMMKKVSRVVHQVVKPGTRCSSYHHPTSSNNSRNHHNHNHSHNHTSRSRNLPLSKMAMLMQLQLTRMKSSRRRATMRALMLETAIMRSNSSLISSTRSVNPPLTAITISLQVPISSSFCPAQTPKPKIKRNKLALRRWTSNAHLPAQAKPST